MNNLWVLVIRLLLLVRGCDVSRQAWWVDSGMTSRYILIRHNARCRFLHVKICWTSGSRYMFDCAPAFVYLDACSTSAVPLCALPRRKDIAITHTHNSCIGNSTQCPLSHLSRAHSERESYRCNRLQLDNVIVSETLLKYGPMHV